MRAYDIRGVFGSEIGLRDFLDFGKAVGTVVDGPVIVARDARVHGEACLYAFTSGVLEEGEEVNILGICPIGLLSYAVEHLKTDIGVMVGASHNPPEYTGLKFLGKKGQYCRFLDEKIRNVFLEKSFKRVSWRDAARAYRVDLRANYIEFILSKVDLEKEVSLASDCMNGSTGAIWRGVLDQLNCSYRILNEKPDGFFPCGVPEPKLKNLTVLMQTVRQGNFDMGLAFDGDGDRVVLVDEKGRVASPEMTAALLVKFLKDSKSKTVVASIDSSRLIELVAEEEGLKVVRVPVGHAHVIEAIKKTDALIGFERSGHITIPSLRLFDDAILIAAKLIEIRSRLSIPLSEFFDKLPRFHNQTFSLECPDAHKFKIVEDIGRELEKNLPVSKLDGVKIDMDEGWILIRASNTQPLIRVTVESNTEEGCRKLAEYAKKLVSTKLKSSQVV
ncbi:MAG: hypothetical protein J7L38_01295 [Thermoproteales archaeon]|nr:hypothetical protein [Thermoproteales archaeon]